MTVRPSTIDVALSPPTIRLKQIAVARSGDKGNHANIGVVAFTEAGYQFLQRELTAETVAAHFAGLGMSRIERFELPRLWALNFLLYDCLAGGASRSLRIDTQGKLLGVAAMEIELPRPASLSEMLLRADPASHAVSRSAPAPECQP
jgi:hypothetical protein